MAIKLGVHTGPQDLAMEELLRLWKRADAVGFHWISVWDHFYSNPLQTRENPCFEGVAAMTALAANTTNVRVGCLVFCSWFRPPGVLTKSAVTIDHLSGGRVELGIGAGWFEEEFRDFGYGFPPLGERLDQLEETLEVVRSLLRDSETSFKGRYHQLEGAVCSPKPVNPGLRLWVGGRGPRRTPALAARFADGFNMPYPSVEEYAQRMRTVDEACEKIGRDPAEIERSVNLHFAMSATQELAEQRASAIPPGFAGVISGGPQQAIERIAEYESAGAQGLNIALRPPIDYDAFEAFIETVLPAFHGA